MTMQYIPMVNVAATGLQKVPSVMPKSGRIVMPKRGRRLK